MSATAAIASSLLTGGHEELADQVLQEIALSARTHRGIREELIGTLSKGKDWATLQRLWKLGVVGDFEIAQALLQAEDPGRLGDLTSVFKELPQFRARLSSTEYIGLLERATRCPRANHNHDEAYAALIGAFFSLLNDIKVGEARQLSEFSEEDLVNLAKLSNDLGVASAMLQTLKSCHASRASSGIGPDQSFIGLDILAQASVALASSHLRLPEACELSLDALHSAFAAARACGGQEYTWYAMEKTIPTVARWADERALKDTWSSIRRAELAIDRIQNRGVSNSRLCDHKG